MGLRRLLSSDGADHGGPSSLDNRGLALEFLRGAEAHEVLVADEHARAALMDLRRALKHLALAVGGRR